jgi:hypothetical protein
MTPRAASSGEAVHEGEGAPELEGATPLQGFELQADLALQVTPELHGREEGGGDRHPPEPPGRLLHRLEGDESPGIQEGLPTQSSSSDPASAGTALSVLFPCSGMDPGGHGIRLVILGDDPGHVHDLVSPSSRFTRRTPWVARPMTRMSATRWRFTTPFRVMRMSSSSSCTDLMETTFPVRGESFMLMTPSRPALQTVVVHRGPLPHSLLRHHQEGGVGAHHHHPHHHVVVLPGGEIPRTPSVARPMGRTSSSLKRMAIPSRVARITSSAPW